jgi:hypothetical protein
MRPACTRPCMARDRRRSRARRCVGERQARRAASRCPRRLVVDGRRPSRNCRANTTLNEAEARLSADLGHRKIRLVCSGDVHLLKVSALRSPSLSDPLDSTRFARQSRGSAERPPHASPGTHHPCTRLAAHGSTAARRDDGSLAAPRGAQPVTGAGPGARMHAKGEARDDHAGARGDA